MVCRSGLDPVDGALRRATPSATDERVRSVLGIVSSRLPPAAFLVGSDVGDGYRGDATDEKGALPPVVLRPATTDELSLILSACNDLRQPLVLQGGRTGLAGGARPMEGELSLSLERMKRLSPVNVDAATIVAEAGVTLQEVQAAANEAGFFFGVDIGARGSCTIGGNVATNAGGIRVLRYGMFRAQVAGVEAVLADGSVLSSLKGLPKDNSGLDLNHLFIGSEGVLGIVSKACLKLWPKPVTEANALCVVPSIDAAQDLLVRLRQSLGSLLSAFEILFPEVYAGIARGGFAAPPLPVTGGYYILTEIQGQTGDSDRERFSEALMDALDDGLASDVVVSQSSRDFEGLWRLREASNSFIFSLSNVVGFDVSVPAASMARFLDRAAASVRAIDRHAETYIFGHLGDGNLHYMVRSPEHDALADAVLTAAAEAGGSISAEHGIGLDKKPWLSLVRSPAELAAMRRLKRAFDPHSILNPGRVFDLEPSHAGEKVCP